MQRYFNIDLGRAVAISLVTAFHVWRFIGSPAKPFLGFDLAGILYSGYVGVDVFFVISGYAIMMTWRRQTGRYIDRVKGFWWARLLRIYPAYFVAIVLWTIMIRNGIAPKPTGIYDIVSHLLFFHTLYPGTFFSISGVFWSLAVEAHFYLLFPVVVLLPRAFRLLLAVIAFAYIIAITFLLSGSNSGLEYALKWNVIGFLPLFILGMELHNVVNPNRLRIAAIIALTIAIGMMLHPSLIEPRPYPAEAALAQIDRLIIGGSIGFFCLTAIKRNIEYNMLTRGIQIIGVSSYSIYLYNYIYNAVEPVVHGVAGILLYTAFVFLFGIILFGIMMWWLVESRFETMRHKLIKSATGGLHSLQS